MQKVLEAARETPVAMSVDTCVVGGGAAGVAAAIAAAHSGQSVLLVEREGFLGGTLTTVSLGSICGMYAVTPERIDKIVGGFIDRVVKRLQAVGSALEPVRWLRTASLPYDLFAMKVVLDELVDESGIRILLHTAVVGIGMDGHRISHILVENSAGRAAIRARTFIDCSGDAQLAHLSGELFELNLDHLQQPTAMFRLGGVDPEMAGDLDRAHLHRCLERAVSEGMNLPRTAGGVFMERPGIAHLNITKIQIDGRAPNPFDAAAMTEAEMLGRQQVKNYQEAFRRYVPGFSTCFVIDSGSVIGIRESRRLMGMYVLCADDVQNAAKFGDAIGCCAWPMEDHAAGRATQWFWLDDGDFFQIPYRSLLPRSVSNLLVAGRCASATHDAQASIRVTAQCFVMGEAAGVAAAMANAHGSDPASICVTDLQEALRLRGAYLGSTAPRAAQDIVGNPHQNQGRQP